jgi:hypothetical protein
VSTAGLSSLATAICDRCSSLPALNSWPTSRDCTSGCTN